MKVLIVAKTRQGVGACIGGITAEGKSVRLVPSDKRDDRWGLAFEIGDVWDVEGDPPFRLSLPHTEDLVIHSRRKIKSVPNAVPTILRHMPPHEGGPDMLFDGLVQSHSSGSLFVAGSTGVPAFSTLFWRPSSPLRLITSGTRLRYAYSTPEGDRSMVYVGFQEPVAEIAAGTLVRISLAHWWRADDRPDDELRCYVQLSGWFESEKRALPASVPAPAPSPTHNEAAETSMEAARRELARVFGFHEFRPLQERIISNALAGRDGLGIMPTGAGKSLCYQLPALLSPGLTVVVSPLLSLMQDQVDQLVASGIAAVSLNSLLSHAQYAENMSRVRRGEVKLLYLAPETLLRPEILTLLDESNVTMFTIDEAHCISEWGHDFRPEYRRLRAVRDRYPKAVCLALTATATGRVREDIRKIMGIPEECTFVSGFDRPNLTLSVQRRERSTAQLKQFLAAHPDQSGIIYCSTRSQVDALTTQLVQDGISALPYHAGLQDEVRRSNQTRFQRDDVQIVVATVAFGMGINKPNVRFVVHCTLPECVETYYQQIGRAGRDGLPANCLLLYGRQEIGTIMHFIEEGAENERAGRMARMQAMLRYAESRECRRKALLPYFGDPPPEAPCGMCDVCMVETDAEIDVDVSEDARVFLTCVQQTRERFGVSHVIDVLRGSTKERILKWRHGELPSHGTGRHRSADEWRLLANRFIERGLIQPDMEHGTLSLSEAGRRVLAGESVFVRPLETALPQSKRRPGAAAQDAGYDTVLFESLRRLRKQIADEARVPPFVVFSDRALVEMATALPRTLQDFIQIHGVGERKVTAYGEQFVDHIRRYAEEHSAPRPAVSPSEQVWFGTGKRRYKEVAAGFLEGLSIRELAEQGDVKPDTIVKHLTDYVAEGGTLDAARILAESALSDLDRQRALACFAEHGHAQLGPIFVALNGEIPYTELHHLRLYLLSRDREPRAH